MARRARIVVPAAGPAEFIRQLEAATDRVLRALQAGPKAPRDADAQITEDLFA